MKATVQDLQFELMKRASFNSFDGEMVVNDLKKHPELWDGVVMSRGAYNSSINLICLRDIKDNLWNVDTVFILCKEDNVDKMVGICKMWDADEVDVLDIKESQDMLGSWSRDDEKRIIKVWWD